MKKVVVLLLALFMLVQFVSALDSSVADPTQTVLTKQILLTQPWQEALQTLFKLPPDYILTLQSAVLLAVLFIVVFFVINRVVEFVPMLEGKVKGILSSIIITLLVCLSGGLYAGFILLTNFSNFFVAVGNWTGTGLVISLAFLIFVSVVVWFVLHGVRKILAKEQASEAGFEIGKDVAESKMYSKIFRKSIGE